MAFHFLKLDNDKEEISECSAVWCTLLFRSCLNLWSKRGTLNWRASSRKPLCFCLLCNSISKYPVKAQVQGSQSKHDLNGILIKTFTWSWQTGFVSKFPFNFFACMEHNVFDLYPVLQNLLHSKIVILKTINSFKYWFKINIHIFLRVP